MAAVLLAPLTLGQLLQVLDSGADSSFHLVWIFGSAAGLAAYAAFRLGASYQALLASLFLVVAWLGFADWVLDEPEVGTFRVLLILAAAALLAGALALRARALPLELSGRDLSEIMEGDPSQSLVGWPLLLLLGGGAALVAGLVIGGGPSSGARVPAAAPPTGPMDAAGAAPTREHRPPPHEPS